MDTVRVVACAGAAEEDACVDPEGREVAEAQMLGSIDFGCRINGCCACTEERE